MPTAAQPIASSHRISSGISCVDDILGGGLTPDRLYLVEGTPGTGKTTLWLQFLLQGAALGECALYVTLSEAAMRMAVSCVRSRTSAHERTIRDFTLTDQDGLRVGEVLRDFAGVLSGLPTYTGPPAQVTARGGPPPAELM